MKDNNLGSCYTALAIIHKKLKMTMQRCLKRPAVIKTATCLYIKPTSTMAYSFCRGITTMKCNQAMPKGKRLCHELLKGTKEQVCSGSTGAGSSGLPVHRAESMTETITN